MDFLLKQQRPTALYQSFGLSIAWSCFFRTSHQKYPTEKALVFKVQTFIIVLMFVGSTFCLRQPFVKLVVGGKQAIMRTKSILPFNMTRFTLS
uniref:Uncharacterized protein n=1 Tax=Tetranychus urticae TaxID=32264 RepID=T1KE21_TETUR